jgi:hypothetical protein
VGSCNRCGSLLPLAGSVLFACFSFGSSTKNGFLICLLLMGHLVSIHASCFVQMCDTLKFHH